MGGGSMRDGGKGSVWIQHKIEGDGWRQYEAGREMTRDGKYLFRIRRLPMNSIMQ